jgi:hypothetical protein
MTKVVSASLCNTCDQCEKEALERPELSTSVGILCSVPPEAQFSAVKQTAGSRSE